MDPTTAIAWVSAGSGLVGALIGAAAALGGKWVDAHHVRKAEKRRQAEDLLARFWEAADRYWRTSKSLRDTIEDIQAARGARHPVDELHARRKSLLAEVSTAEVDARFLLARMRLNGWPIAVTAGSFLAASRFEVLVDPVSVHQMRETALAEFEEEARRLTGASDLRHEVRRRLSPTYRRWKYGRLWFVRWRPRLRRRPRDAEGNGT